VLALRALFLLSGAILGVFYPFVPVILAGRGFDPGSIGLVTAISSLGFTLAVPVWGHLADVELGRARALRLAVVGSTVAVLGLLAPVPPVLAGGLVVVYALFECAFSPLTDALAVNALDGAPRAYGRVRLLSSLGFSVAAIAAGRLYDDTGYAPASILWTVLAVLMVVSSLGVPDVARLRSVRPEKRRSRRRPGFGSFGLALRIQPRLVPILAALTLIHVGIITGFTFLSLRLLDLGAPPSDIALSAGISALAEVPAMALVPRLVGRLGVRVVLPASILLYGACIASWAFLAVPGLIIATRVGTGLAFAGVTVSAVITIGQLLPRELQGTGQALYQTVAFGASAVIANSVGGVVYASGGPMPLFLGAAALAVVGSIVAFGSLPRRGEAFVRAAIPAEPHVAS
jgi:PPP family 3-phenylpropionic acid transporter